MFLKKKIIKIEDIDIDHYDKYVQLIVEAGILLKEYKFDEILIGSLDYYFAQSITYVNGSINIKSSNLNIYNHSGLMKIFTDSCGYSNLYAIAVYYKQQSVYIKIDNPTISAMNLWLSYDEYYAYCNNWICTSEISKDRDRDLYFDYMKIKDSYMSNKNKLPYKLYMDIVNNKFGEFAIDESNESRKNSKFVHMLDVYGFAGDIIFEVLKFKGIYSVDDLIKDIQYRLGINRKPYETGLIGPKTLAAMYNKFCVTQDGTITYNKDTGKTYIAKNGEFIEIQSILPR